jgi:hypothetical protein
MKEIHEPVHWDIPTRNIRLIVGTSMPNEDFFNEHYDYVLDKTMAEIKKKVIVRFAEDIDKLICFNVYRQQKEIVGFVDLSVIDENYKCIKEELETTQRDEEYYEKEWSDFFDNLRKGKK